jgi:geranylgeranyl reductase family protein
MGVVGCNSPRKMTDKYQVVIVGAGPAGSSAAYFLGKSGIKTLLLDKFEFPRDKLCGGAISPRALSVLDEMSFTPLIKGYQKITGVRFVSPNGSIVDGNVPKRDSFRNFGYVVPRISFDVMLRDHALTQKGAEFQREEVVDLDYIHKKRIKTISGKEFEADFVILANGAVSNLARKAGSSGNVSMPALEARFEGVRTDDKLFIYFHRYILPGYLWIFPEGNGKANVGIGMSDQTRKINLMEVYNKLLSSDDIIREVLKDGKPIDLPKKCVIRSRSQPYTSQIEGILSIGDNGGFANQFSGEGIYYALQSGKLAARTIEKGKSFAEQSNEFEEDRIISEKLRWIFQDSERVNEIVRRASENSEFNSLLQGVVTNVIPKKEIMGLLK